MTDVRRNRRPSTAGIQDREAQVVIDALNDRIRLLEDTVNKLSQTNQTIEVMAPRVDHNGRILRFFRRRINFGETSPKTVSESLVAEIKLPNTGTTVVQGGETPAPETTNEMLPHGHGGPYDGGYAIGFNGTF